MKNIEAIREEFAKEKGWDDFRQMITIHGYNVSDSKEIAERYMKQAVNTKLEEAADNATIVVEDDKGHTYTTGQDRFSNVTVSVHKESILSLKFI